MSDPVFVGYAELDSRTVVKVYSNGTTSGDVYCVRRDDGDWQVVRCEVRCTLPAPVLTDKQNETIEKVFREYVSAILARIIEEKQ